MKSNDAITFAPIVVGVMRLGTWGVNMDTQELERYIDECLEHGLSDFDHADIYGHYTEEAHFGEVIKRRPDLRQKMEITTKCGIKMRSENRPDHRVKSYDSTAAHIIQSTENSLKELGVERLKLLLLHRPDYLLDPSEVAEAFERLKNEGKVQFFGVSNYTTSQFELLNAQTPLVTNQLEVSLTHPDALDDGTLDQSLRLGLPPMAWSPFGGGQLFTDSEDPQIKRIQQVAGELGETYGASLDQLLLAWILKHPARIVPVIGSSKIQRVKSALDATKIQLSHEDWYQLLEASRGEEVP
ncbi:MAG: aldo/keto reductase [Bacteroidota bacterium]